MLTFALLEMSIAAAAGILLLAAIDRRLKTSSNGPLARDVVQALLGEKNDIPIFEMETGAPGDNHFDAAGGHALYLTTDVLRGSNASAVAVGLHEAAHAVEWRAGSLALKLRFASLSVASIVALPVLPLLFMGLSNSSNPSFAPVAACFWGVASLLHALALPSEWAASNAALGAMESLGYSKRALREAEFTLFLASLSYGVIAPSIAPVTCWLNLLHFGLNDNRKSHLIPFLRKAKSMPGPSMQPSSPSLGSMSGSNGGGTPLSSASFGPGLQSFRQEYLGSKKARIAVGSSSVWVIIILGAAALCAVVTSEDKEPILDQLSKAESKLAR